jgi:hypothetical protein
MDEVLYLCNSGRTEDVRTGRMQLQATQLLLTDVACP